MSKKYNNSYVPQIKHKKLPYPLITIIIKNYNLAKDQKFLNQILDDVYESIGVYFTYYDLFIWKTSSIEIISFYYAPEKHSKFHIMAIKEQLNLLTETELSVKISIEENEDYIEKH